MVVGPGKSHSNNFAEVYVINACLVIASRRLNSKDSKLEFCLVTNTMWRAAHHVLFWSARFWAPAAYPVYKEHGMGIF